MHILELVAINNYTILTGILFVTDDQNFYHINYDEFKNHHK
jgi:hypothetical protein